MPHAADIQTDWYCCYCGHFIDDGEPCFDCGALPGRMRFIERSPILSVSLPQARSTGPLAPRGESNLAFERNLGCARAAETVRLAVMAAMDGSSQDSSPDVQRVIGTVVADSRNATRRTIIETLADHPLRTHGENVMLFGLILADLLGLDDTTRRSVALAGLVHDIGGLALETRGAFAHESSPSHAEAGHALLHALGDSLTWVDSHVLRSVRHHHENLSGASHPDMLIPKVVAVADMADLAILHGNAVSENQLTLTLGQLITHPELDPELVQTLRRAL